MPMGAIPTFYDGIEYRSRLEARWAAFFDQLGWQYTYEPFDGDYYIPDFVIHGGAPLIVEIKPAVTPDDYQAAATRVARGLSEQWQRGVVILGIDPLPRAGFMRASRWWPAFRNADWQLCPICGGVGIGTHVTKIAGWRPCGHAFINDYPSNCKIADPQVINQFWASACNNVRWRGRDA